MGHKGLQEVLVVEAMAVVRYNMIPAGVWYTDLGARWDILEPGLSCVIILSPSIDDVVSLAGVIHGSRRNWVCSIGCGLR